MMLPHRGEGLRLTPRGCTDSTPPSAKGHPSGRTWGAAAQLGHSASFLQTLGLQEAYREETVHGMRWWAEEEETTYGARRGGHDCTGTELEYELTGCEFCYSA